MIQNRLPSFRGMEAFLYLVETGGLRAASRALNLSVSAVSHRLRAFEAELGEQLFYRGQRELILTPAAKSFYEDLRPIPKALSQATTRLKVKSRQQTLTLSVDSSLFTFWLASRLPKWQDAEPDVQLDIHTSDAATLVASDITIQTITDEQAHAGLLRLFGWTLIPVCRPELVARFSLSRPADLARVPLIDFKRPRGAWECWLQAADVHLGANERSVIVDEREHMIDAAARGLGVAIGVLAMMDEYRQRGLVTPFNVTAVFPGGAFVNRPETGEKSVVSRFRKWLIKEASEVTA